MKAGTVEFYFRVVFLRFFKVGFTALFNISQSLLHVITLAALGLLQFPEMKQPHFYKTVQSSRI
jgi:hypothetical protein